MAASALMSMLLCLMCVYSEESYTGLEFKPIIEYMLTEKSDIFLNSSSLYAAPLVACSQWNNWFPLFLPVLCAVPFIRELSFEMKGAYRFRVTREKKLLKILRKNIFPLGAVGFRKRVDRLRPIFGAGVYLLSS